MKSEFLKEKNDVFVSAAPIAKGKYLDNLAALLGLKRKRYFLFFKESDEKFRKRTREYVIRRELDEQSSGWIPCSERLPEENQKVMLQDFYGNITIETMKTNNGTKGFSDGDWWSSANNYLDERRDNYASRKAKSSNHSIRKISKESRVRCKDFQA